MRKKTLYIFISFLIIINVGAAFQLYNRKPVVSAEHSLYPIFKDIIDAEEYIAYIEGKVFPRELLQEITISNESNKSLESKFDSSFVMCTLFSTLSCTICLDSEMKKVEEFYQYTQKSNLPVSVIGIAHSSNKNILLRFKRSSGFTFPLFLDEDNKINKHFKLKNFPMTLFIHSQSMAILSANHPVKDKLEWSDNFYTFCKRILRSNLVANK